MVNQSFPTSSSTPVASAAGGGVITSGGTVIRGSFPSAGKQSVRGAGSVSGGQTIAPAADLEAARKAADEVARQAKEEALQQSLARKKDFQVMETARQEQIFSGTIAGQLSSTPLEQSLQQSLPADVRDLPSLPSTTKSRQQPSFELPKTSTEKALGIGTGVQGFERFDKNLFQKAGREFFFIEGTPIQAAGTLAAPLQRFFTGRKGDIEFQGPTFGTVSDERLPFGAGGGETFTGFERLREQALIDPSLLIPTDVRVSDVSKDISKELVAELQPQVTEGTLTVEEAEKQFETKFEERFQEKIPDLEKGISFRESVGRAGKPVIDVKPVAELTAIGAGSLSPVGAAVIGASFVAEGIPNIGKGILGEDLTFKERAIELGTGGVEVGFGLAGIGISRTGLLRQERAAQLDFLSSQVKLERGARFEFGEGGVDILKGGASIEGASIQTEVIAPFIRRGGTTEVIGGKGTSTIKFQDFFTGDTKLLTQKFGVAGDVIPTNLKGFGFQGAEKFKGFAGDIELTKQSQLEARIIRTKKGLKVDTSLQSFEFNVERFPVSGIGAREKDIILSISGKPTTVISTQKDIADVQVLQKTFGTGIPTEFNIKQLVPKSVSFQPESVTALKVVDVRKQIKGGLDTSISDTGFGTGLKTVTKTDISAFSIAPAVSQKVIQKSITPIVKPSVKPAGLLGVGLPKSVGGQGLDLQSSRIFSGTSIPKFDVGERGAFDISLTGPASKSSLLIGELEVEKQFDLLGTSSRLGLGLGDIQQPKLRGGVIPAFKEATALKTPQAQIPKTPQKEFLRELEEPLLAPPITPRTPFAPRESFRFATPFLFPPLLGGTGTRRKPKRRVKARVPIRPSFTGIVLGIEDPGFTTSVGGIDLGVLPGTIRGLETGFKVPKRKKSKKKKSKKK